MRKRFVICANNQFCELPDNDRAQLVRSMTVGELREAISDAADDSVVLISAMGYGYSVISAKELQ